MVAKILSVDIKTKNTFKYDTSQVSYNVSKMYHLQTIESKKAKK